MIAYKPRESFSLIAILKIGQEIVCILGFGLGNKFCVLDYNEPFY